MRSCRPKREFAERPAIDPVVVDYLALPVDEDGIVPPKHRERAARLTQTLKRREQQK